MSLELSNSELVSVVGGIDNKSSTAKKSDLKLPSGQLPKGPVEFVVEEAVQKASELGLKLSSKLSSIEGFPIVMPHMPSIMAKAKIDSGGGDA
ncbi:MAG: hypothetical protein AB7O24_14085 [Kofleriaceae bacterium]